jgi:predicted nucleotidyltransferase component of viral defense system
MSVSHDYLARCSTASGYDAIVLEKVIRLGELAGDIAKHGFLGECLALKGGTALQLCFGPPSRLSVDLDFNYIGGASREQMLADRPSIEKALTGLASRRGYTISRSRPEHAGGKIFLGYRSALGTPDRVEVDLNFLFRTPLNPVAMRSMWQPPDRDQPLVQTVGLTELLVGKLLALLARNAARDLWDVANLTEEARVELGAQTFRSWFVGIGSVLNHPLTTYGVETIGSRLTQSHIDDHLGPMLTRGKTPRLRELVDSVRSVVAPLLDLSQPEQAFVSAVAAGNAPVEILFPDDPHAQRVLADHPALAWKLANVRRHLGKRP